MQLNFDDKIFFHEPVNKYYDLLHVRKLAWNSLLRFKAVKNPIKMSRSALENVEDQIKEQLDSLYAEEQRARLISIKIERLALLV